MNQIEKQIVSEIQKAINFLNVSMDLRSTINSWGDTLEDDEVLGLLQHWNDHNDTDIARLLGKVSKAFNVSIPDMMSKHRSEPIAYARFAAMALMRKNLKLTYEKMGELFNKDHSAILHGCQRHEELMQNHTPYKACYDMAMANTKEI